MKQIHLKFAAQQLSKEQMKNVVGGEVPQYYDCWGVGTNIEIYVLGDNCDQAQANADSLAYSDQYTDYFPNGINCIC